MSVVQDLENQIGPLLAGKGFELVDVQYRREAGRWVLRLFIDKTAEGSGGPSGAPSGVTLDDCEKASEWVESFLDAAPLLESAYVLEVSSPGVNRVLKTESHFRRFIGEKVKVSLFAPLTESGKQKNFSGILTACGDGGVELEDAVSGKVTIPLAAIAKANLDLV